LIPQHNDSHQLKALKVIFDISIAAKNDPATNVANAYDSALINITGGICGSQFNESAIDSQLNASASAASTLTAIDFDDRR
jgi:hypothetical protein